MAFSKVTIDHKQQATAQATYSITDRTFGYTMSEYWNVTSDSLTTRAAEVTAAAGLPVVGALYTVGGSTMYCTSVMPQRAASNNWTVQVNYGIQSSKPPDSERWAVELTIDGEKWEQEAFKDRDSNPIYNSAGQYFSPSLTEEHRDLVIEISYQTSTTDINLLQAAEGKTNSDAVTISIQGFSLSCAANTLLLDRTSSSSSYDPASSANIWKINMRFVYRADTYTIHVPDRGYCELKEDASGDLKLFTILDKSGRPLNQPSYLDGDGHKLDIDPSDGDTGTPIVFVDVDLKKQAALSGFFSVLGGGLGTKKVVAKVLEDKGASGD